MTRTILNVVSFAVVTLGAAHTVGPGAAQQAPPAQVPICCTTDDGAKCCGSGGCETSQGRCSAW